MDDKLIELLENDRFATFITNVDVFNENKEYIAQVSITGYKKTKK